VLICELPLYLTPLRACRNELCQPQRRAPAALMQSTSRQQQEQLPTSAAKSVAKMAQEEEFAQMPATGRVPMRWALLAAPWLATLHSLLSAGSYQRTYRDAVAVVAAAVGADLARHLRSCYAVCAAPDSEHQRWPQPPLFQLRCQRPQRRQHPEGQGCCYAPKRCAHPPPVPHERRQLPQQLQPQPRQ